MSHRSIILTISIYLCLFILTLEIPAYCPSFAYIVSDSPIAIVGHGKQQRVYLLNVWFAIGNTNFINIGSNNLTYKEIIGSIIQGIY
jgi:hypothetical protein